MDQLEDQGSNYDMRFSKNLKVITDVPLWRYRQAIEIVFLQAISRYFKVLNLSVSLLNKDDWRVKFGRLARVSS
jgi:hypothetical protein